MTASINHTNAQTLLAASDTSGPRPLCGYSPKAYGPIRVGVRVSALRPGTRERRRLCDVGYTTFMRRFWSQCQRNLAVVGVSAAIVSYKPILKDSLLPEPTMGKRHHPWGC